MITSALALLVVAGAAALPWPPGHRVQRNALLTSVEHLEALAVDVAPTVPVAVDAITSTVTVHAAGASGRVVAAVRARSALCPRAEVSGGAAVLHCVHNRLHVALTRRRGRTYLDIQALRGVPRDLLHWRLPSLWSALVTGARCGGSSALAGAACALNAGRVSDAARALARVDGPDAAEAAVLLGSLAEEAGEPGKALLWYQRAFGTGRWLALVRVARCELGGECAPVVGGVPPSLVSAPPEIQPLLALRIARARALLSARPEDGALYLAARSEVAARPCAGSWSACHAILARGLAGTAGTDKPRQVAALEAYLALVALEEPSPLALDAARAAAERLASLGVPALGATLLAHHTASVPRQALAPHLARVVELFLADGDRVRARSVRDWAEEELGARVTRRAPWPALDQALLAPPAAPPVATAAAPAAEGRALLDLALARTLTARAATLSADGPQVPRK
ncbi:MAG: hypothetical protein HY904_06145 [Deltaproteobacteria bacterium]|nr:hypothetical protein [Deltaproteobacteria bacterium]